MRTKKRVFMFLCFLSSLLTIGLISAGMATDGWVVARAVRQVDNTTKAAGSQRNQEKFNGNITIGLFHGSKKLDYGLGGRPQDFWILDVLNEHNLFNFGLWLSTIIFLCIAVSWAIVSAGFALLNMNRKPVETISGSAGIYLWNLLGLICNLTAIILFVILFYMDLNKTLLIKEERNLLWTTEGRAKFYFSFWLVVGALGAFILSVVLVHLSGQRIRLPHRKYVDNGGLEGVMMY